MRTALVVGVFLSALATIRGQQNILQASFDKARGSLVTALQIKCPGGGEKIQLTDVYYKINACRAVEFRPDPNDGISSKNLNTIEQCTGKRLCVLHDGDVTSPFLAGKNGCSLGGFANELSVLYKCIPQEKIRPLCSSFESLDSEGYLATQHYPLDLNTSEGKNPCVCDLRAAGSGLVRLTFVEMLLGSESSHVDPAACQLEDIKQYVQVKSSYGMSSSYSLCVHKYNAEVPSSQVFKIIFGNPIKRQSGKLWLEYSVLSEEIGDMVKVNCYELQPPAGAIKKHGASTDVTISAATNGSLQKKKHEDGPLLAGALAALLFVAIMVVLAVVCVLYRRKIRECLHARERPKPRSAMDVKRQKSYPSTEKPMALIAPTSKDANSDGEMETDMDVKSFHPLETFIYTKPSKSYPMTVNVPCQIRQLPTQTNRYARGLPCNDEMEAEHFKDSFSESDFGTESNRTSMAIEGQADEVFPPPPGHAS